ncbi:MAG: hydrogenase [Thermoanaerobaculaceae bacterium]
MAGVSLAELFNGSSLPSSEVPRLGWDELRAQICAQVGCGARLAALAGRPVGDRVEVLAVLVRPEHGILALGRAEVGARFASLTPTCVAAHLFERELAEQWGEVPEGHPWLKPVRFHRSYRPGHDAWDRADDAVILPCVTDFFRVDGEEVHEVAVGPVHAGVIEPGHFRFQCHGEHVLHLEIALGYQHRGVERALLAADPRRALHLAETLAGDSTVAHATAHCLALEALGARLAPPRAEAIRAIALELERLANHVGDLGALAGDVGFLPTQSFCGRLRGDILNLTALVCGNRFGRNLVRPGGVAFDLEPGRASELGARLQAILQDVRGAMELLFESSSVMSRFEGTGPVPGPLASELGLVGVAARASGLERDVRAELPVGMYRFFQVPVSTWHTGDVFARAWVRWREVQRSAVLVNDLLAALPQGALATECPAPGGDRTAVAMVEGWRGEVCHVVQTDPDGRIGAYKVVDPSFHNWMGLAMALRDQQISDFPLCNKSFNLSYCGHDL